MNTFYEKILDQESIKYMVYIEFDLLYLGIWVRKDFRVPKDRTIKTPLRERPFCETLYFFLYTKATKEISGI